MTIPDVHQRTAEVLIAEIGVDMSAFPTPKHLASWAGVCPGNNESGGKFRSGRTRKGSKWLRATLAEASMAATKTKDSYLAPQYQRLRGRRGPAKAVTAVGHSILSAAGTCCKPASCTGNSAGTTTRARTPTAPRNASTASSKRSVTT